MWKDLSMGERAALIRIAVDSGVHSIDDIVNTYNSYAEGGELKDITPTKTTPTKQRKFWETDEEYKERIDSYNKVDTAAVIAENQRIAEENNISIDYLFKCNKNSNFNENKRVIIHYGK